MFKRTLSIILLASCIFTGSATAAFIPTDWVSQGDALATLDTDTGLEWLDLTQTGGKSINDVKALLDTTYAGWRLPTYEEVRTMASTLFPAINSYPGQTLAGNYGGEISTFEMFGQNVAPYTYGLYEKNGKTYFFGVNASSGALYFDYLIDTGLNWKRSLEGVYLVSDGGTTISSINNPTLNANNPNAPINQGVADVHTPAVGVVALLLGLASWRRRKTVR